jgi:hypothetical protein
MVLAIAKPSPSGATEAFASGITRRAFAAGAAVTMMLTACRDNSPPSNDVRAPDTQTLMDPAFLSLSQVLTGHADLDPLIAGRIAQAFRRLFPDLASAFEALAALAKKHPDASGLLQAASATGQQEAALAIVAAWYTGTVGTGLSAQSVAYAAALMNRPVADALAPPTYQLGGPGWWIAEPPPVNVAPPVERASVQTPPIKSRVS